VSSIGFTTEHFHLIFVASIFHRECCIPQHLYCCCSKRIDEHHSCRCLKSYCSKDSYYVCPNASNWWLHDGFADGLRPQESRHLHL